MSANLNAAINDRQAPLALQPPNVIAGMARAHTQKNFSNPHAVSREYVEFKSYLNKSANQISVGVIKSSASAFRTLADAFEGLPEKWLFAKSDLREMVQALEMLDSNHDLKVSAADAQLMAHQFPRLQDEFRHLPKDAYISSAAILQRMLTQWSS